MNVCETCNNNLKLCIQFDSVYFCILFVDYYKFWLKSIDRFSDESTPVIVVGTHADKIEETVIMYLSLKFQGGRL